MTELHFKKFRENCGAFVNEYEALWRDALTRCENDIYSAMEVYMDSMSVHFARHHSRWSKIETEIRSSISLYPAFMSVVNRCPVRYSFSAVMSMPEAQMLLNHVAKLGDPEKMAPFLEQIVTIFMAWYQDYCLKTCGDKVYLVKPDLRWALENTDLKGYPADLLRLPFPTIYVDVENLIEIVNPLTGMHKASGVYITEDTARETRTWRILIVGKGKEESPLGKKFDDALYHYQIMLPEGKTVDDAIEYSFSFLSKDAPVREIELDFEGRKIKISNGYASEENREQFIDMWGNLLKLFKYVMNVMIYVTSQDADVKFGAASPEYRALQERAMRAEGKKRRALFDRLKTMKADNAYILGGNIVIDRKPKTAQVDSDETEHRKQKVRSLVSGHFRLYHIGVGRTEAVTKWIAPFWRGPEHAPLTTKAHVVK